MVDIIDKGWAYLSNGTDYLKVYCQHILITPVFMPEVEHYEGGVNIGYDLARFWLNIKLVGVWVQSNTEYEAFVSNIKSWQQANTLRIEISRDGTNKAKLDGTNTIFPVLVMGGLKEMEKMPYDQQIWKTNSITLEQNGSAS